MNKKGLVSRVASKTELSIKDATVLVDAVFYSALEGLIEDGKVDLSVFGKMEKVEKAARKGRNPGTGEEIDIPAKFAPRYKPSKTIKEELNK